MNTKRCAMLVALCVHFSASGAGMDTLQGAKCALGFIGAGVAMAGSDYFRETPIAVDIADYTGLDVDDVATVAALPFAAIGIRELVNDDTRAYIDHIASRAIPAAASSYIAQTKVVRTVFGKIPFFGQYLRCENEKCTGSCQKCKLRTGLVVIGSYMTIDRMFDAAGEKLTNSGWNNLGYVFASFESKNEMCKPK